MGRRQGTEEKLMLSFFMIPISTVDVPQRLADLKAYFQYIARHRITPTVLLALSDLEEPKLRENPQGKYARLEAAKLKIVREFGIPENTIFFSVPYLKEQKRSFAIERNLFLILQQTLSNASMRTRFFPSRPIGTTGDIDGKFDFCDETVERIGRLSLSGQPRSAGLTTPQRSSGQSASGQTSPQRSSQAGEDDARAGDVGAYVTTTSLLSTLIEQPIVFRP
jgi:hypothetical protein